MINAFIRLLLQPFTRSPRKTATLILLFVAGVSAFGAYSMRKLETSYSMRQFMPADHPLYKNDDTIRAAFNLADEQPILVTIELNPEEKGTWLDPARLEALKQATQTVAAMNGIQRATSLATIQFATDAPKGLLIGTLPETLSPDAWLKRVQNNAILVPGLLSRDYRVATIIGDIPVTPTKQAKELVNGMRENLPKILPFGHVRVSGIIPIQLDVADLLTSELGHFLILAFLLCVVTLCAYFRSFSTVSACLLLVVISDIGALGYMALAGYSFSILSTSVPILASITALVIGTHTLINYANEWHEDVLLHGNPNRTERAVKTYASLFLPNFLMAFTTAVGFATLTTSSVPLIRQYAWSISGGIMISWLLVSVALLPLMVILPPPQVRKWTSLRTRWALWVVKRRWLVFSTIALTAFAMWLQGGKLNWSVMLFDDLPTQNGVRASSQLLDRDLGGMIPLEMMVSAPKEQDPWTSPERVEKLGKLLASWRQDPIVGSAVGLPDFVRVGENFTKVKTNKAYAEIFFLYSLSGGNNVLNQYLTPDGQATRVAFRLKDTHSDEMERFSKRVEADMKAAFPDLTVTPGGMATMVHVLDEQLSREMISGLWESLFYISILVIVIFRSVLWALAAAIPNLLSPLALLTTMSILKTPIKPGVAIIFSIALGVAYNNTVYLLSRLKLLQDRHGKDRTHLIEQTWFQEGNPCFFSTLTLLGGFAIFLSSFFLLNRIFGAYMLLSICAGMLGDLVFLPTLAKICPWLLAAGGTRKWLERTGLLKRDLDVLTDRST